MQQAIAQYQKIACQRRLAAGQSRPAATSAGRDRSVRPGTAPAPADCRRSAARSGHVASLRLLCRWRGQAFPGPPWPAGGWRARRIHAEGDEHSCRRAPAAARNQPGAPADHSRRSRPPSRHGQHSRRPMSRRSRMAAWHRASMPSSAASNRPTHLVNSKIYEVILNPYWTAPRSIVEKDIVPLMRKDPTYLRKEQHSSDRRQGQRSGAGNHRLECREGAEPDVPSGSGQDQRDGLDEDQLPQQEQRVHARHAAAGPVQQADALRVRPAAFASRTSAT